MTSPDSGAHSGAAPDPDPHADDETGATSPVDDSSDDPGRPEVPRYSWRHAALLLSIAVVILLIDLVTKLIAVANIAPGENIRVLGGAVYLTMIRNPGAAFSMATGMTWLLAIIAVAVVIFIIRMAPRLHSTPWAVLLGLVLGGALGNLTDRLFRAPGFLRGHVVDFISVFGPNAQYFPAFNAADCAITVGGVLLVVLTLFGFDYDGTRHRGKRARVDG